MEPSVGALCTEPSIASSTAGRGEDISSAMAIALSAFGKRTNKQLEAPRERDEEVGQRGIEKERVRHGLNRNRQWKIEATVIVEGGGAPGYQSRD